MHELRLNLGSGPLVFDGETNVDMQYVEGVEVIADIFDLPFSDESVKGIRLDHVLEHQPMRKAYMLIHECARVLESGGTLRVGVPDFASLCESYVKAQNEQDRYLILRTFYGGQQHDGEYHKSGWDGDTLTSLLEAAGFAVWSIEEDMFRPMGDTVAITGGRNLVVISIKP